jgi:hypothetical protein
MSNIISNNRFNKTDYLNLSQKEVIIFLSLNDQKIKGQGCVGFDISELGWEIDSFENQKKFLLKVIDNSLKKKNWGRLNYIPKEEYIFSNLRRFREMIVNYSRLLVKQPDILKWNEEFNIIELKKCNKHNVYMHPFGCKLCNS